MADSDIVGEVAAELNLPHEVVEKVIAAYHLDRVLQYRERGSCEFCGIYFYSDRGYPAVEATVDKEGDRPKWKFWKNHEYFQNAYRIRQKRSKPRIKRLPNS